MSNVMGTVIMFQSTHSLRSATPTGDVPLRFEAVSIHALLAECDLEGESEPCHIFGFNPRTPCGVRHNAGGLHMSIFRVSIHALLAECDINDLLQCKGKRSFNPRTPCGVRQARSHEEWRGYVFQSTHSLRSATNNKGYRVYLFEVSIHALLAECDVWKNLLVCQIWSFNPRTPCGVRRAQCCGGGS